MNISAPRGDDETSRMPVVDGEVTDIVHVAVVHDTVGEDESVILNDTR
jgi:CBS domain containing-hemolysin-like protein